MVMMSTRTTKNEGPKVYSSTSHSLKSEASPDSDGHEPEALPLLLLSGLAASDVVHGKAVWEDRNLNQV
jgi:hypothetical protein